MFEELGEGADKLHSSLNGKPYTEQLCEALKIKVQSEHTNYFKAYIRGP